MSIAATTPGMPVAAMRGAADTAVEVYVTLTIGGQLCGIPVGSVRDVLGAQAVTRIPLAPPEVAGSLNLRGRIVTAIDLRRRLGLPPAGVPARRMSVVVDLHGELYSLQVDEVGEVMNLLRGAIEPNPPTLDPVWQRVTRGIHRLDGRLLAVLDVARLLDISGAGPR
jgi:purine-binding chemotaxis protein CheW